VNSYWELPARLFDDSEELSVWARAALAAAQHAAMKKRTKARRPTKVAQQKPAATKAPAKVRRKKAANKR